MKRLFFILLFLVMGLFITITLSSVKVYAEPNEEENPVTEEEGGEEVNNEEETTTETNEDEVTEDVVEVEDKKNYEEIRQSIAEILDSIDELRDGNVNWFEDELINHLLALIFGAAGTLLVTLIYLKKTKLVGLDITNLITGGKKTDEELVNDMKTNMEFIKKQSVELGIKEEQINKLETSIGNLMGNFNEKVAELEKQLKAQNVQNNEMLEILKIAFLNNPDLVSSGYATKIEGIINKYEQK